MSLTTRGLQQVRVEPVRAAVAPSVTVNCGVPFAQPGITAVPGAVTTAIPVQPTVAPAITAQPIVSAQPLIQAFAAAQVPGLAPQVAAVAPGVTAPAIQPAAQLTLQQRQQLALTCLASALGTTPALLQTVAAQVGVDPISLATSLLGVAAAPAAVTPAAVAPVTAAGIPASLAGLAAIDPLAAAALAGFPGFAPGAV